MYKEFLSKTITYCMYVVYIKYSSNLNIQCTKLSHMHALEYTVCKDQNKFLFYIWLTTYCYTTLDIRNYTNFDSTCTCLPFGKFATHINEY